MVTRTFGLYLHVPEMVTPGKLRHSGNVPRAGEGSFIMTPRRQATAFILASLVGAVAIAQPPLAPPPAEIPENDSRIPAHPLQPMPSSVKPFVVPPATPQAGPPLPNAPPAPALSMLVLVPRDVPPNQPIPYTITVKNDSSADASRVRVRMPLPEGAELISSEPVARSIEGELTWDLKTVPRGETRKIEVKLKAAGGGEINAKAFVSYEFGQAVRTRLSAPQLKVATELPREATTAEETVPVRVRVANGGRVPVNNVKLTETISEGFEFHRDTDGEPTANPLVRTWDLGTIPAGMGKTVEYRVVPKTGRDLLVRSNVDAGGTVQDTHESRVKIQDAKLQVELRGDPEAQDGRASFKVTVRNEGATTLYNVRVTGSVPQDCQVVSRTNGGQIYRDGVVWVIPRLTAGDSFLFKWDLKAKTAGRKTVRAEAASDRGLSHSMDVQTVFAGAAALVWEQRFDQPTVNVDRTGMFTVKVTNSGSEAAKQVKLVVTLPEQVKLVQATPAHQQEGNRITFEPRDIAAGGAESFSITFRGEQTGAAYFQATLTALSLGDRPMTAEKYVQITTGR